MNPSDPDPSRSDAASDPTAEEARKARRPQRAATVRRRQQILDGALECFTAAGVEHTTVADICRVSEASVGSLYHHFGSKEGVAGSLFIKAIGELNADLLQRLSGCRSVASGVRMVVTQYSDWVTAHPELARHLHSNEVEFTADHRTRLRELYRAHITAVFDWFAPHVVAGQMRQLPLDTYVPLISGPIRDYTRQWLGGRVQRPPAQVKEVFADAAWNAVRVAD